MVVLPFYLDRLTVQTLTIAAELNRTISFNGFQVIAAFKATWTPITTHFWAIKIMFLV